MNPLVQEISASLTGTTWSLGYVLPELALTSAFLLVMVCDLFLSRRFPFLPFVLAFAGIGAAAYLTVTGPHDLPPAEVFSGMIRPTGVSASFKYVFYAAAFLFLFVARGNSQLREHKKGTGDLYAIFLATLLGMNLMAMAANLLMIYISVEMVSVGGYLMVGYLSASGKQAEAAMKYALFGGVCSAAMLYGMSLLYAMSGTLSLFDPALWMGIQTASPLFSGVAIALIATGIGFKISFVPFHFWSPDVYEGAPTPVTAFLSVGPKLAGFAVLLTFLSASAWLRDFLFPAIALIAIATMIAGNFSALLQDNTKRMLAYSSIGHTGFMLMAVNPLATDALLFYAAIYTLMNMAAFMLANEVEERTGAVLISSYRGLGRTMPLVFVPMVVVVVSLTGLPPTAGFLGKVLVFGAAWTHYQASGSNWELALLCTGALTTVVALFYYLKIPLNAWLRQSATAPEDHQPLSPIIRLAMVLAVLLILLGLFPGPVLHLFG